MYLVVGLGNPGKKYENTRHNIGFIAIDYLAQQYDVKFNKSMYGADVGEGKIGTERVYFVKPMQYMNLSGGSVSQISKYFQIPVENIIVLFDDASLPLGKIRIRQKGSSGGHNGIKHIILMLASDQFPRVKLGVSDQYEGDIAGHVLAKFPKSEVPMVVDMVKKTPQIVEEIIANGIHSAMNKYNFSKKSNGESDV